MFDHVRTTFRGDLCAGRTYLREGSQDQEGNRRVLLFDRTTLTCYSCCMLSFTFHTLGSTSGCILNSFTFHRGSAHRVTDPTYRVQLRITSVRLLNFPPQRTAAGRRYAGVDLPAATGSPLAPLGRASRETWRPLHWLPPTPPPLFFFARIARKRPPKDSRKETLHRATSSKNSRLISQISKFILAIPR